MATSPPRRPCCDQDLARLAYDGLNADADLARWHDGKLNPVTRELIDVVQREGVGGARILDIGAGVGAIHLTLLEAGAATAVDVDASREYLAVAQAEAERRGLQGRVEYRYGDVVELADDLPGAEIVTLDSVICCYPHLEALLDAASRSGPRLVGNLVQAIRRIPARYFIHRHERVEGWMAARGYQNVHEGGIRVWRVVLYRRTADRARLKNGQERIADAYPDTISRVGQIAWPTRL